jgi:hypothetical protein
LTFLAAIVFSFIPLIGRFVNVINTMVHETGHAIISMLFSGEVDEIKLNADTSGSAKTKSKYWIGKVLTSLVGYPASCFTAWLFFYLINKGKIDYVLYSLIGVALINIVLWVRNAFGIIWILLFLLACFCLLYYPHPTVKMVTVLFFSGIILIQSFTSTIVLFVISIKQSNKAGDAKNLQEFMFLPAAIWALFFIAVAIYTSYQCVLLFPCFT